jgi:hypothetical protein
VFRLFGPELNLQLAPLFCLFRSRNSRVVPRYRMHTVPAAEIADTLVAKCCSCPAIPCFRPSGAVIVAALTRRGCDKKATNGFCVSFFKKIVA